MMPIVVADCGEEMIIRKVGGSPEVKLHLENLGIVPGGLVTLINVNDGSSQQGYGHEDHGLTMFIN